MTEDFLRAIHCALERGGTLRFLTDQADYAAGLEQLAAAKSGFVCEKNEEDSDFPLTTFEKGFRERSELIYQLLLRKVSGVR